MSFCDTGIDPSSSRSDHLSDYHNDGSQDESWKGYLMLGGIGAYPHHPTLLPVNKTGIFRSLIDGNVYAVAQVSSRTEKVYSAAPIYGSSRGATY